MSRAYYCHLNINSIQKKIDERKDTFIIKNKLQIVAVSETKIDCSYPVPQFLIPGYYLHQNDQKKGGGGVLLFVSSKILSKSVTFNRSYKTIEPLALELGLKSRNAIILVINRLPKKLNWYIQTSTRGGIKSYCQQTGLAFNIQGI